MKYQLQTYAGGLHRLMQLVHSVNNCAGQRQYRREINIVQWLWILLGASAAVGTILVVVYSAAVGIVNATSNSTASYTNSSMMVKMTFEQAFLGNDTSLLSIMDMLSGNYS
jgi:hypothetical protein